MQLLLFLPVAAAAASPAEEMLPESLSPPPAPSGARAPPAPWSAQVWRERNGCSARSARQAGSPRPAPPAAPPRPPPLWAGSAGARPSPWPRPARAAGRGVRGPGGGAGPRREGRVARGSERDGSGARLRVPPESGRRGGKHADHRRAASD